MKTQILPIINRDNCLKYAQFSLLHLMASRMKRKDFKEQISDNQMLDPNQFLDDLECESESSMKAERDSWLDLYENCFDCIFTNLVYILQNHLDQFLELKHFEDPMLEINQEED